MILSFILVYFCSFVLAVRYTQPNGDPSWPVLYLNNESQPEDFDSIDVSNGLFERPINNSGLVLPARDIRIFNSTSPQFQEALFRARLSKTSNCKPNYDKWACDECKSLIPDGEVVRTFSTFPVGTTGLILVSNATKTIQVIIRGASSIRNKILFAEDDFVPYPFINGSLVRKGSLHAVSDIRGIVYNTLQDQLHLHPDYRVEVTGHSYGAAVGSLLIADIFHRFPQLNSTNLRGYLLGKPRVGNYEYARFFYKNNLKIKRYIEGTDDVPHHPDIRDGFVHEGDEYWYRNEKHELVACSGPYETRSCANSLNRVTALAHLVYFGIRQDCESDFFNIL